MAYIGPEPNPGQNREVDDISSSFNGSTTAFTLQVNSQNVSPGSSNNIIVSLGGVVQNPTTDYTINSSTITFSTAPASGLSFFGLVLGQGVDAVEPADGSVSTIKIADQAVTLAKLPHGTGSNDGKFLRANNGADPTFETVTGTTINNNADNRIITGSGTANTLEGEASFTFDAGVADITGKLRIDVDSTSGTGSGNVEAIFLRNTNETDGNAVAIFGGADDYSNAGSAINFVNVDHSANVGQIQFDTRSAGGYAGRVQITSDGHLKPVADNSYDLGGTTQRWRNLYTNDLKLSNEGSSNDVDGTWGNYTIQEGAEDLFLINHRTGKKFKFNLTEVS
jgi:hypothetical protein